MKILELKNVTKRFAGASIPAVNNISFDLEKGEILAIVGPSGCGKTTILRLVAGLEHPDAGTILINGITVASATDFVPPEKRGVGLVFQDHALFPHLTVFENVAFGLKGRKREEIQEIVFEVLRLMGMEALAQRYPHTLSGGERQRVALARALAPHPVLILMDEPFSSLDADMRLEMREQLRNILKSMQATSIFVTHDQEEALFMGDRIVVLRNGQIEQLGTPEEIFHAPATRFVAEFMGDSDFLPGLPGPQGIQTEIGVLPLHRIITSKELSTSSVEIALRADDINFVPDENGNAVIVGRFFRGAFNLYRLRLPSGQILHALKEHTFLMPVGTKVQAYISAEHSLAVFPVNALATPFEKITHSPPIESHIL